MREAVYFYRSNNWQPVFFLLMAAFLGLLLACLPWEGGVLLVGGTAVFLLTFIQPLVGIGVMLLVGPLSALQNILFGSSPLDAGQIMLLFTTAVWLARGCLNRQLTLPHAPLIILLALFIFTGAVTLLGAISLEFGLKELLKWLEIGWLVVMVTNLAGETVHGTQYTVHSEKRSDYQVLTTRYFPVLWVLLLAGFSQAVVGIWQFSLSGTGPGNGILGHFYLATEFFGQRVYGTFEQPNPFGGFMNLTALLAAGAFLGWLASGQVETDEQRAGNNNSPVTAGYNHPITQAPVHLFIFLFLAIVAAMTTAALVLSSSRGAWLGFAAGAGALVLFWPRKRWQGVLLLLIGGLGLLASLQLGFVPASIVNRLSGFQDDFIFGDVRGVDINDENYAVLERLAHWQAALDMAREQPWLGVGLGNYEPAYPRFGLINWPFPLGHAHNYYLNLLAETGVMGLLAYGVLWTAVFGQTIRLLRYLDWPHRGVALGLLAAWVAFSVHHLVDKLYVNNIYLHVGVMLALLQLLENEQPLFTRNRQ